MYEYSNGYKKQFLGGNRVSQFIFSNSNVEIGRIENGKLIPKKVLTSSDEILSEATDGYQLARKGEEVGVVKGVEMGGRGQAGSLIAELKATGVKFIEADLKFVSKNSDGFIMFLEKGNSSSGLQHIIDSKWTSKPDFQTLFNNNIDEMIGSIQNAINKGPYISRIIDNQNRLSYIYKVQTTQGLREFKIATGTNGYIVSFIPNW